MPRLWSELETLTDERQAQPARAATARSILLERMPDYLVAQQARVARTFQNIRLFPGMTVLENLLVAQHNPLMLASGFTVLGISASPPTRAPSARRSTKRGTGSTASGSSTRADDPAGELPYGEQRRLEIARAMCTDPVLLCRAWARRLALVPDHRVRIDHVLRAIPTPPRLGALAAAAAGTRNGVRRWTRSSEF